MAVSLVSGGLELAGPARAKADKLAAKLTRYRDSYYAGKPEISDAAFDELEEQLRALDPTHAALTHVGSGALSPEWDKAQHVIAMGSLNKATSVEELREWYARCQELSAKDGLVFGGELFVAEKLDGLSIELIYEDGKFKDAITRGDGEWGERISTNVRRMKGVPPRIPASKLVTVRGEIIMRLSDMKAHFPDAPNPRNAAAGTSKRLDGVGCEHLTVLLYDLGDVTGLSTETDKFTLLRSWGFPTPRSYVGTLEDILQLYQRYLDQDRGALDYEIDGLVVSVADLQTKSHLGDLNRRPRGAVALKFPSQAKLSRVESIIWDTGPSGRVTPVAVVQPVSLAGATVTRASLHNMSRMKTLGIGVGDQVLVSRRNDVIPYVEEVVDHVGAVAIPPEQCPVCQSPLKTEGEYLVCGFDGCRARVEGRIRNWIDAIGALEWGDKLIAQLVNAGIVKKPVDLYRLEAKDIAALERRGDKSAAKCLAELRAKLPLSLSTFLAALGIDGFAEQSARLLVRSGLTSLDSILRATEDELAAIAGLGAIKAQRIVSGLSARKSEIEELVAAGIVTTEEHPVEGPLSNKTFCFTGAQSRPRTELVKLVEAAGGRVLSSVSKDLTHLVIADPNSTSSKAEKARKLGTKLISEDELMNMLGSS